MIMQEQHTDNQADQEDDKFARAYLALVHRGLQQKRATPVVKRKESEAHYVDALEAATDEHAYELLVQAVDTDPGNAAALRELKDYFDLTLEEDLLATRGIVAIAEKRLGKKGFTDNAGHFWSFLETRPYMQARADLANLLYEADMTDEAIAEWEALLALNPNDDQGARHFLIATCLEYGHLDKARALFDRFPNEAGEGALFVWCGVLERLLLQDDAGAAAALAVARTVNGFAEAYLLGHRQLPKELPDAYTPGSREEASFYAPILCQTWSAHPAAVKWLEAQPKARK